MLVKINKSEDLDNYVIKVSINNQTLTTNEISSFMTTEERLQIELFLTLDYNYSVKKRKFFMKILLYMFGIIYLYFRSLDEFLDSREYKNTICVESLNKDDILEINYFWNEQEKKVDVKIEIINGNIITNEISEIKNQAIYNQKLKYYNRIYIWSWILLFIIPITFLILACIFNHKKMIIAQIVVLIVFLIFFLLINRKKKKMKL